MSVTFSFIEKWSRSERYHSISFLLVTFDRKEKMQVRERVGEGKTMQRERGRGKVDS